MRVLSLLSLFLLNLNIHADTRNCTGIVFSDCHITPADLRPGHIPTDPEELLNNRAFHASLRAMRAEAEAALRGGADCISILFNGDPFDRPTMTPLSREQLRSEMNEFASHVRNQFQDLPGNPTVEFIANVGDHDIRKLASIDDIPANAFIIQDSAGNRRLWYQGESALPEGFTRSGSLRDHYRELESSGQMVFNEKKGIYRWLNGDDVLRVEEFSPAVAAGFEDAGWRLPELPNTPHPPNAIPVHDPRMATEVIELSDGQRIRLAHIDNSSNPADIGYTYRQHMSQGQMGPATDAQGRWVFGDDGLPEIGLDKKGNPRNFNAGSMFNERPGPRVGDDVLFLTADGHNHRRSLALVIDDPVASSMIPGERVLNSGTTSSVMMREENAMNGFASFSQEGTEMHGLDLRSAADEFSDGVDASKSLTGRGPNGLKRLKGDLKDSKKALAAFLEGSDVEGFVRTPEWLAEKARLEGEVASAERAFTSRAEEIAARYDRAPVVDYDPGTHFEASRGFVDDIDQAARRSPTDALEALRRQGVVPSDPVEHIRQLLPCL